MIVSANRLRSIGWIALLLVCFALVMVMAFRVNALRSQVHRAEERIIALRQEKVYLETELETRANQQQLKTWNDVEFGYVAPGADQYLENERQLAALSMPEDAGAPAPIRVASTDDTVVAAAAFPAMVSPLTGQPVNATDDGQPAHVDHDTATAALGDNLGKVRHFADAAATGEAGVGSATRKLAAKDGEKSADGEKSTGKAKAKPKAKPETAARSQTASKAGEKTHGGASASAAASAKPKSAAKPGASAPKASARADTKAATPKGAKLARAEPRKSAGSDRSASRGPVKIALKDAKHAK